MIKRENLHKNVALYAGDCLDVLKALAPDSVDAVVTDPPYGLGFMGRHWDHGVPGIEYWRLALCVLKPGGHLVAFSGTRTYHRMVVAIEDAGFEIRDQVGWCYGSGFPKSLDVSKEIDKRGGRDVGWFGPWLKRWRSEKGIKQLDIAALFPSRTGGKTGCVANWELGLNLPTPEQFNLICANFGLPFENLEAAEREVTGRSSKPKPTFHTADIGGEAEANEYSLTRPATDAAREWQGWGTALKPAWEPIVLARKPLGTGDIRVRENVEREIKSRGWTGEIKWLERAESAVLGSNSKASSKTPSNAGISAESAVEKQTTNTAHEMVINSGNQVGSGTPSTDRNTSTQQNAATANCVTKSSPTMVASVRAAVSTNPISSPSTTSTAAAIHTDEQSAGMSTPTLERTGFPPVTERFAGIVTGLTDSMETVHIRREAGSFVWPENLPTFVPSKSLTVAANVLRWRTGALNIDACRVGTNDTLSIGSGRINLAGGRGGVTGGEQHDAGRWPANMVHDGSEEVVGAFPSELTSGRPAGVKAGGSKNCYGHFNGGIPVTGYGDTGSAARFFYTAKADDNDRIGSKHPTVKPVDLMQWLARLVTPPGGLVLDPFAGTGTTGEACMREGFHAVLIERESEYQDDIRRRIKLAMAGPDERSREIAKAKSKDGPLDFGPLFGKAVE